MPQHIKITVSRKTLFEDSFQQVSQSKGCSFVSGFNTGILFQLDELCNWFNSWFAFKDHEFPPSRSKAETVDNISRRRGSGLWRCGQVISFIHFFFFFFCLCRCVQHMTSGVCSAPTCRFFFDNTQVSQSCSKNASIPAEWFLMEVMHINMLYHLIHSLMTTATTCTYVPFDFFFCGFLSESGSSCFLMKCWIPCIVCLSMLARTTTVFKLTRHPTSTLITSNTSSS